MSAWRRELLLRFPEFGHSPESWSLIEAQMKLGSLLESAARTGDREVAKRIIDAVVWADGQTIREEQFIYFCQDVLRSTVATAALRPFFVSLLNSRTFSQLVGYIEYVTTKEVVAEMAEAVQLRRHARQHVNRLGRTTQAAARAASVVRRSSSR
jgi:hypothetical protein